MRPAEDLHTISDKDFDSVYHILMQSQEKRDAFFLQPERVLLGEGIKLGARGLELLKGISTLDMDKGRAEFDEKLVLCSSSGY